MLLYTIYGFYPPRYGIDYPLLDTSSFVCAACQDHCNCSLCLGKVGYRGRVDAFRGIAIRMHLRDALKGTGYGCTKELLDSKIEEAGGLDAWVAIEGCEDMEAWLYGAQTGPDAPRRSTTAESDPSLDHKWSSGTRGNPRRLSAAKVRGADEEVDLSTLLAGERKGKGKGKAIDSYVPNRSESDFCREAGRPILIFVDVLHFSDGETVSEPDHDDEVLAMDIEHSLLANGTEHLLSHLTYDEQDEHEDDPADLLELGTGPIIRHFSHAQLQSSVATGLDALAQAAAQNEDGDALSYPAPSVPSFDGPPPAGDPEIASAMLVAGPSPAFAADDVSHEHLCQPQVDDANERTPSSAPLLTPEAEADGEGRHRTCSDDYHDSDGGDKVMSEPPSVLHSISVDFDETPTEHADSPMTMTPHEHWDYAAPFQDAIFISSSSDPEYAAVEYDPSW